MVFFNTILLSVCAFIKIIYRKKWNGRYWVSSYSIQWTIIRYNFIISLFKIARAFFIKKKKLNDKSKEHKKKPYRQCCTGAAMCGETGKYKEILFLFVPFEAVSWKRVKGLKSEILLYYVTCSINSFLFFFISWCLVNQKAKSNFIRWWFTAGI